MELYDGMFTEDVLGHALRLSEMLCIPLRGRFDPVLLENFVLMFLWCLPL